MCLVKIKREHRPDMGCPATICKFLESIYVPISYRPKVMLNCKKKIKKRSEKKRNVAFNLNRNQCDMFYEKNSLLTLMEM